MDAGTFQAVSALVTLALLGGGLYVVIKLGESVRQARIRRSMRRRGLLKEDR